MKARLFTVGEGHYKLESKKARKKFNRVGLEDINVTYGF